MKELPQGALKEDWCGPAAMTQALKEQGYTVNQEAIGLILETEDGTSREQMVEGLTAMQVPFVVIPDGDLSHIKDSLRKRKSVIVDWQAGGTTEDGHYSLIARADDKRIVLHDNQFGGNIMEIGTDNFLDRWRYYGNEDPWALAIG